MLPPSNQNDHVKYLSACFCPYIVDRKVSQAAIPLAKGDDWTDQNQMNARKL